MPLLLTSTCFSLQRVAQCPEVLGPLSARFRDGVHGHPKPSAPGYCVFISGRTSQCVQPTLLTLVVLLETPPLPVPACDLPSRGPPCPSPEGTAVKTKQVLLKQLGFNPLEFSHNLLPVGGSSETF